jgi:hypothetical protein
LGTKREKILCDPGPHKFFLVTQREKREEREERRERKWRREKRRERKKKFVCVTKPKFLVLVQTSVSHKKITELEFGTER